MIWLVFISIIGYDIFNGIIIPSLSLSGCFLGFLIGAFVGKYANIHWSEETGKVISKLDRTGIVIIVLYLTFSFSKNWLFGHWIQGQALSAFSFSVALGVMTGRIIIIRKQIRVLLREKGLLEPKEKP